MRRTWTCLSLAAMAFWMLPTIAVASPDPAIPMVPPTMQWVLSLVGLVVAVIGLYMINAISKLTKGGAISHGARFIITGFLCLGAASILTTAWSSFNLGVSGDFVAYVQEALRIVAMGLFVMYFHAVLTGLRGYVHDLEKDTDTSSSPAGGASAE